MGKFFRISIPTFFPVFFASLSLLVVLSLASCSKSDEASQVDTTTSIPSDAAVNAIEEVASDKEKLRQAIILADSKGTLEAALTEAAQDSIIRDRLRAALAAAGGMARTTSGTPSKKGTGKTIATTQKKDALDQINDGIDAANRTIDRTSSTVDKANEAGKKADELLRGGKR